MTTWITKKSRQFFLISLTLGLLNVESALASTSSSNPLDELGWKFAYDDSGRISKVTDAAGRPTDFQYVLDEDDHLRKLTRTAADGSNVILQFDERGQRTSMRDKAGTVSYEYDNLGRLILVQREETPAVTYTYDTQDRIKILQVGDFYRIEYAYDFLGRLESMKTPAGIVRYDYMTDQGITVRTLPNGVKTFLEYEPNGKLKKITHGLANKSNANRYRILTEYSYQYRPDGLIKAIKESSENHELVKTYEYDTVGRLKNVSDTQGNKYNYKYDSLGNRVSAHSTAMPQQNMKNDWSGKVTSFNGYAGNYDAVGNLTELNLGKKTLKYQYNNNNQVSEAFDGKVSYHYNGEGRLLKRKTNTTETFYIPNPLSEYWQPLVIENNSGQKTYVVWDSNTPLLMIENGKPKYLLHDHLGSVRLTTDEKGKVNQYLDYKPFGAIEDNANTGDLTPGYGGLFWDPAGEIYLTSSRAYSPQLGRFLQIDPLHRIPTGSQKSLTGYSCCGNDPVNFVDLDGAECRESAYIKMEDPINLRDQAIDDLYVWNKQIRDWEQKRQIEFSSQLVNKIRIDAHKTIRDSLIKKITPHMKQAIFGASSPSSWLEKRNQLFVVDAINSSIETLSDDLIEGRINNQDEFVRAMSARIESVTNTQPSNIRANIEKVLSLLGEHIIDDWDALTSESLKRYGVLANRFHSLQGFRASSAVLNNATRASNIISKFAGISSAGFEYITTGLQYIDLVGKSMVSMNAPIYLRERTLHGMQGFGMADIGSGNIRWGETLTTRAKNWYEPGNIHRVHWDQFKSADNTTRIDRSLVRFTPAKSFFERFMMRWFPVQDYYAPGKTIERRTQRTSQSYREETVAGKKHITGLMKNNLPDSDIISTTFSDQVTGFNDSSSPTIPSPVDGIYLPESDDEDGLDVGSTSGGPGSSGCPGCGGGGPGAPGGFGGSAPWASQFFKMTPSPVGGVYLGGSGQALDSIGLIEGISLDSNNNLILLSKSGGKIDLPPLRIDDVVTIFRSVYLNGEGPTVTIDPNPVDPEGSAMIVRHSKATEDTYVGWVLFQADRLMKGYTLGRDNDTTKEVKSAVPGYDKVLNTIYFGGESPEKLRKKGNWERFWIVPAEARRFGTDKTELTLVDVPLKVKTQSMKWVSGELKDDIKGKSSPGATAFTDWFTGKYDRIAEEQYLTPPPESGITKPVPVFTELRRIALITAIAEKLRNQSVPLPFWMRDYEVRPVPIDKFTPGLKVTRSNQRVIARVYGGAQMSAADKDVKDFTPVSNLANLPKTEQQSVRRKIKLVGTLEKVVQDEMLSTEPLKVHQFKHKGVGYQGVVLPGSNTQALAPGRLLEVDLSVPVEGGHSIQLARHYNSFFNPNGLWGKGWTFNLPHLERIKVPTHRTGTKIGYQTAYELITPLNSGYTRFSQIEKVPELKNSRLLVPDHPSEFFGIADSKPQFLSGETDKLIRKDGGSWHFSKAGQLIAVENGGFKTVYERDGSGRLTRIAGMLGMRLMAFIDLKYEESGKLSSATAYKAESESESESDKTIINYRYDNVGRLSGIESESGKVGIRYKDSWVTAVTYQAKDPKGTAHQEIILRSFEYNSKGQLLSETGIDGTRTNYQIVSDSKGSTVTTVASGQASGTNSIRYDPSFRPVEARYANGSQATWDYSDSGGSVLHIKEADGAVVRITESADQRQRIMEFDNKYTIAGEFDSAGRLTSVSENGHTLMEQEWSALGKLRVVKSETQSEHYSYDEDGLLSRIIQAPPNEKGDFSHYQETRFDPAGRPVEIKDDRGRHLSIGYDANGELAAMFDRRDGNNYGFNIDRDTSGRVHKIKSSWEDRQYTYDTGGHIKNLAITKKGMDASAEWKSGLLHKVKQFDGGESTMSYYETPGKKGLIKSITTPNQLTMIYEYDQNNQLREVDVGNIYKLKIDYDASGKLTGWRVAPPPGRPGMRKVASRENSKTASSPVSQLRPVESLEARRADSRFASEGIRDVMILDHSVVNGKPSLLLAVNGKVRSANKAVAVEFDRLLKITATTVGKMDELQRMWADFVESHLIGFGKVRTWEAHNRQTVSLKPRLIIKSNQTNYKYTNLERIPALVDNFNVYVTHSPSVTATSLVKKIRGMPRLRRDNVLFVFRLPEMEAGMQRRWQAAITELQKIVGQDNVRLDPSKTELQVAMNQRDKDVVVFEFAHTEQGIVLKDSEKYQADDILHGESLSHIKYLIGLSCCNLQKLEQGRFVDSLQKKGVGIVDGPAREVGADVGLQRLEQMIEIMGNIERYEKLPLDYLQDVIDQLQNIEHGGMIKVGEHLPQGVVEWLEACA